MSKKNKNAEYNSNHMEKEIVTDIRHDNRLPYARFMSIMKKLENQMNNEKVISKEGGSYRGKKEVEEI